MSTEEWYQKIMRDLKDIDASSVLKGWKKPTEAADACFGSDSGKVNNQRPTKDGKYTVVFLSYENPKGASGGILAVIRRLPAEIRNQVGNSPNLIRLSPLHTNLNLKSKYDPADLQRQCTVVVPFDDDHITVEVYKVAIKTEEWYLFSAKDFFEADGGVGGTDPYIYGREDQEMRDGDESLLLHDSLFACRAMPEILKGLGMGSNLIIHAQDWEFATSALTVKEAVIRGDLARAAVSLTLHNPYDHVLSDANLRKITDRCGPVEWPDVGGLERTTVLTRMIPLLDAPVSVVSHQFARELTNAPIQTGVFTSHLLGVFRAQGLVGIDNGDFGPPMVSDPFTPQAVKDAYASRYQTILDEKAQKRQNMLVALAKYLKDTNGKDPATLTMGCLTGGNGGSLEQLPLDVPVFMMVGRLDPGQKGYDVCAQLIRSLPKGFAKFVLTPMSPLAADAAVCAFFAQLKELVRSRQGDVVVLAHRMTNAHAYKEIMEGSTYGLWPSLYEPWGGASEFYACGTPVVAHAVGGLVQQVVDYRVDPSAATGFLYRSQPSELTIEELERQYREAHRALPGMRMQVPVYRSQWQSLQTVIKEATKTFQTQPQDYGRMLANLPSMRQMLSWQEPVKDYLRWYDTACV